VQEGILARVPKRDRGEGVFCLGGWLRGFLKGPDRRGLERLVLLGKKGQGKHREGGSDERLWGGLLLLVQGQGGYY